MIQNLKCRFGFHKYNQWATLGRFQNSNKLLQARSCSCCAVKEERKTRLPQQLIDYTSFT